MPNPIADPLVEGPDSDTISGLAHLSATGDGVATLTINNPGARNAFDEAVIAALHQTLETVKDSEVRLLFVRGQGGTFSAGADLGWMARAADMSEAENRADAKAMALMLNTLFDLPQLTVALVEGGAYGGGAGLVAACDMAIAKPDAKFSFSEVKLGIIPGAISPYVIRAIGPRHAKALFATGRVFDAEYAKAIGLVSEVAEDFEPVKRRLAGEIKLAAPGAVREAQKLVDDFYGREIDGAVIDESARRIARARVSKEGQEGVRAFLEKRKPSWAAD